MPFSKSNRNFLESIFKDYAAQKSFKDNLQALLCEEYIQISQDFEVSKLQESWSWRNVHISRELAKLLIDEKGEINRRMLFKAIQLLEENLYSLGPKRSSDGCRQKHLLKTLKLFYDNPSFPQALKKIGKPIGHPGADHIIRETLLLPEGTPLSDAHARQAALSALLTLLRQNVGSCFATAPAILIQQELPLQFLADLEQLLGTGSLKRVKDGMEYSVPLSPSWGMGDLLKPISWASLGDDPVHTLARSPGLISAFTAAGLISQKHTAGEKKETCVALLLQIGFFKKNQEVYFSVFQPQQLLQTVLLKNFEVTEQEVENYTQRKVQWPFGELIIQTPQAGKALASSRYLKAYEAAKRAFKGLTDNALLKAWEFTLASLSESKADFAKWNLYLSLGVNPEDPYGIGQSLYQTLQEKINTINEEMTSYQSRYDHLYAQAKYLEGRMRSASEKDFEWVKAEYQLRRQEINRAIFERDEFYEKGRKLQGIYSHLINFYGEKIRDYFQEVYDAEMHDIISSNPYDDSPAGFRLMYKFGRVQTSLWTMIYSASEYIEYLTAFFVASEVDLLQLPACEGIEKEVAELVSTAINTIKKPEFLESSLVRLARAYQEPLISHPLENLSQVKRKPWVYISGGTMSTLIQLYWKDVNPPRETKRWVESENEYLAFLIDTIKELPYNVQRLYQEQPEKGMLAFTPTHAFVCKPGWSIFRQAWENDLYTYTWIKQQWLEPQQQFLSNCLLDSRMIEALIDELLLFFPEGYRTVVRQALGGFSLAMTPFEMREHILQVLSYEKWLRVGNRLMAIGEEFDSLLLRMLPLFPEHQLREKLVTLFEAVDEIDDRLREQVFERIGKAEDAVGRYRILSAQDLREIAQGLLILTLKTTRTSIFYTQKILEAMQKTGLCYPSPFLFADTNWVNNVFGMVVNPGTAKLELWRFDDSEGRPISAWKRYLNGTDRQDWGLYTQPHQYGS